MKRVRVLVVDDEPVAREGLRTMLSVDPEVEVVDAVGSGRAAVDAIRSYEPDLVFLDVRMPDLDGFDVLEAVEGPSPAVVFVTAYEEFALRAFEVHALDYLLKPFGDKRLGEALAHAKRQIARGRAGDLAAGLSALRRTRRALQDDAGGPDALDALEAEDAGVVRRLNVRRGERTHVIDVSRIDWIEGAGDYARLNVGDARHLIRMALHELEAALDPVRFARIHRSTIVNLDRVREYHPVSHGDYAAILRDGTRLRVSRTYRPRFLAAIGGCGK